MIEEFERDEYLVLRKLKSGLQPRRDDMSTKFSVALLIAEYCVDWNEETDTLSITEKGEDVLEWLKEEYR